MLGMAAFVMAGGAAAWRRTVRIGRKKAAVAALTAWACSAGALAQGNFDFGNIPGVPDQPNVQIDLDGPLLDFVVTAAAQGDPEAAKVLEGLEGIRVRVYEELRDTVAVNAFVEDTSRALEGDGWQRVVYVQDGGEKVRVYARMEGQQMSGMTVLVVDATDAVFINIDGRIDPAQLGRIAAAMGMTDVLGPLGAGAGASR